MNTSTLSSSSTRDLAGQVALVTGGARGLGATLALALAQRGADVAISYVNSADRAAEVVASLEAHGVRALAVRSDQSDPASAQSLVDAVLVHFGKLDLLINNAAVAVQGYGVDHPAPDLEALEHMWRTNVHGVIATTRAASARMSDGGRILFIGSGFGSRVAFAGVAEYAATKAALIGYARGAARDLGTRGITVNVLQPGIMPTDMSAGVVDNLPDALMDLHSIRRIANLEEVAATAVHLLGPHGGYISGSVFDVSGGYTG